MKSISPLQDIINAVLKFRKSFLLAVVLLFLTISITWVLAAPTEKTLIKDPSNPTVYWYQNGKYYPVFESTLNTMQNNGMPGWSWSSIVIQPITLFRGPNQNFISTAIGSNGLLIKLRSNSAVYEIKDGKREFLSQVVFNQRGYSFNDVIDVPQAILDMFPEPTFSFEINSPPTPVTQGQGAAVSVKLKSLNGFNSSVKLHAINLPSGYDTTRTYWNPETFTPPSVGYTVATLYLGTNNSTKTGTSTVTLKAIGGGIEKVIDVNFIINSSATPSFSVEATPATDSVAQNESKNFTLKITSLYGFNKQVKVEAINLPPGYDVPRTKWSSELVTPPANGIVQPILTVATNSSTAIGTSNITLRASATDGSVTKETMVSLTVTSQTTQCGTSEQIRQDILNVSRISAAPEVYLPGTSWVSAIRQSWLQQYREFYLSAHDAFGLTQDSLKLASRFLSQGDLESACKHLNQARHFNGITRDLENASIFIWQSDEEYVPSVLRKVADKSKAGVKLGSGLYGPKASLFVDMAYLPLDYALDKSMYGEEVAIKNFKETIMTEVLVKVLLRNAHFKLLKGKTIEQYLDTGVAHEFEASLLYTILEEGSMQPDLRSELILHLGFIMSGNVPYETIERLAIEIQSELINILRELKTRSAISSLNSSSSKVDFFNEALLLSQPLAVTTIPSAFANEGSLVVTQPQVITTVPTSAAASVAFNHSNISVTFNENIQLGNGAISIIDDKNNSIPITQKSVTSDTLNISLGSLLNFSTVYRVNIEGGAIRNMSGVNNEPYQWSFTTISPELKIGDEVTVANTGKVGLNLRSSPAESASIILSAMPEGTSATIIGGPVQESGYSWWNIRLKDSGTTGWSAVGHWLSPTDSAGLRVGATVTVSKTSGLGLRLRREPGLQAERITTLSEGTQMNIIGGPYYVDGYLWWNLRGAAGTGFSAVSYWLFPSTQSNNLKISDVQPSALQVKDWNQTITYTITVTDKNGSPLSGAIVSGQNDLQGTVFSTTPQTTNASGQINYTTNVPNGKANGIYNIIFLASKSGYPDSAQVTRQVQVNHTACTYSINPTTTDLPAAAGTGKTVAVTALAGCQWTASTTDSWITITAGASGTGNGTVTYSVAANSGAARAGTITAAGKAFTVLQNSSFSCSYTSISYGQTISGNYSSSDCTYFGNYNDVYNFNGAAGDQITISSSFPNVNLQLQSNGVITPTSSANGTQSYTLPTTGGYTLFTSPSLKFNEPGGTGSYTLSLTRVSPCAYSINPTNASLVTTATTGNSFAVSTSAGCQWTASTTDNWITITAGASGTGNGTVTYSVVANSGAARAGTITAAGKTFTVNQSGVGNCSYSIGQGTSGSELTAFQNAYTAGGGEPVLGCATAGVGFNGFTSYTGTIGHYQTIANGRIEYLTNNNSAGQAFSMLSPFVNKRDSFGLNSNNRLGYPVGVVSQISTACLGTQYKIQRFEGGSVIQHLSGTRVNQLFEVHGLIHSKWMQNGPAGCKFGLPTSDEKTAQPSGATGRTGVVSEFEDGQIYFRHGDSEAFEVHGYIENKYFSLGSSGGWLGFPISNEYVSSGFPRSDFEGGYITTTDGITYTAHSNTAQSGLQYYPLAYPIRLLDTRSGQPACYPGPGFTGYETIKTQPARVPCQGLTIPTTAQAIVGTVSALNTPNQGNLRLYPAGEELTPVSNVNFAPGRTVSNSFTVKLGTNGAFNIYSFSPSDVIIDVTGYYAPPTTGGLYYHQLPNPIRILETRPGEAGFQTPGVPLAANSVRLQQAHLSYLGVTIPATAKAVTGNATVVNSTANAATGKIKLYPGDIAADVTTESINYVAGQTIPNAFTVRLDSAGQFKIHSSTQTHFLIDITGYYSTEPAADQNGSIGLLFNILPKPFRLLDTRAGEMACDAPGAMLSAQSIRVQTVRGRQCSGQTIPSTAKAIFGNGTVVNNFTGAGSGNIRLYPGEQPLANASNLNYAPGDVIPNSFIVGLGTTNGAMNIYSFARTHFIVDVSGYFAP